MICYRTVDVSAAVAPVGARLRFIPSVVVVDSSQGYDGLPRGRRPSQSMPWKPDGILHFKSNPPPEAVYLPRLLPVLYLELL